MVVLTPDSPPPHGPRTLYHPQVDNYNDLIVFGHAKSLTATCLDLDLSPANEEEEDDDICSLRTTTVSQGVINLMSGGSPLSTTDFTTIQQVTV
jgi:hypothetical protein